MAPSANDTADSSPLSTTDTTDNNLQPFFILHKVSSKKSEGKSTGTARTRRRIDLSPRVHLISGKLEGKKEEECVDNYDVKLRKETFQIVWSKIESTIKDVLRQMNAKVFTEILHWVRESFNTIRSCGTPSFPEATQSFPIVIDATSTQLFAGLVLTKNMEFVDDLLTFEELGIHLKSQGCHVANLSSSDFSTKHGIGGCLRSLMRQLLSVTLEAADIAVLASWYREKANNDNPVVIIIDDVERCCGPVLSELILMLSEWAVKIPVILILGVATTLDALRNILPASSLQRLSPYKFTLGTPAERMDAVVETVLVKHSCGFRISRKVALFMRNYFVSQDGTLTSFIRALKLACAQHLSTEPLSFLLGEFLLEESRQVTLDEKYGLVAEMMLKRAFDFPSSKRNEKTKGTSEDLARGLSELKRLQIYWGIAVLFLFEAGRGDQFRLLDLICEALDPESYHSRTSDTNPGLQKDNGVSPSSASLNQPYPGLQNGGFISQILCKLRDLSGRQLFNLFKRWENLSFEVVEIHNKVKELQSLLKSEDGLSLEQEATNKPKRHASQKHVSMEKDSKVVNEKASTLIKSMLRDYMRPIECIPFHEIVCFKNVDTLRSALIGDPRRRIHVDLLEFHKILRCTCCCRGASNLLPSMSDTSIMFVIAQEHGDLINLHDWYQSFKSIVTCQSSKGKKRLKQSPVSKKRKDVGGFENLSEALIQAKFCRAVTELQITGLVRMPTKRRPDFIQRVGFGL